MSSLSVLEAPRSMPLDVPAPPDAPALRRPSPTTSPAPTGPDRSVNLTCGDLFAEALRRLKLIDHPWR